MADTPTTDNTALPPSGEVDGGLANSIGNFLDANLGAEPAPEAAKPAPKTTRQPDPVVADAPVLKPFSIEDIMKASRPQEVEPSPEVEEEAEQPAEEGEIDTPAEAQKDGREKNAWTRIKGELKREKAEKLALKKELEAARAAPQAKPEELSELEALRKSVQDQENMLGQIEITRSKSFQKRYDMPIVTARAKLSRALAALGDRSPEDAAQIVQALESCRTIQEARDLVSGESGDIKGVALTGYMELQEHHSTRNQAVEDWRNTRPAVETEEDRVSAGERLRQIVDATASALPDLSAPIESKGEGSWIFMDQPDDVEWTDRRNSAISTARATLRDAGVERVTPELAKIAMEGAVSKLYRKFGEDQFARANELQATLDRRNKTSPRVNGGGSGSAPGPQKQAAPDSPKRIEGGLEAGIATLVDAFHADLKAGR